jgi:hypothetical protein
VGAVYTARCHPNGGLEAWTCGPLVFWRARVTPYPTVLSSLLVSIIMLQHWHEGWTGHNHCSTMCCPLGRHTPCLGFRGQTCMTCMYVCINVCMFVSWCLSGCVTPSLRYVARCVFDAGATLRLTLSWPAVLMMQEYWHGLHTTRWTGSTCSIASRQAHVLSEGHGVGLHGIYVCIHVCMYVCFFLPVWLCHPEFSSQGAQPGAHSASLSSLF